MAVVQAGSHHNLRKVAICAIVLVQPYKIRPSNSSQSEDKERDKTKVHITLTNHVYLKSWIINKQFKQLLKKNPRTTNKQKNPKLPYLFLN